MIPLTSKHLGTKRASERGQISIFFASSLIVLISIIAFVINIGLFVKAKINLQNATDASAYAGAAVQARMLTRIGYMNWELRNNYKEWMFKYYVLGNLNINDVRAPAAGSGAVSYRMEPDPNIQDGTGEDVYNFPSVCLHYAGVPTNVCRRYAIPGIPRFEPTNLVGIDETTSSFIDAIVKEKSSDCSKRTQLNFNITNLWAYNLRESVANSAFADAPQVAVDRVGAWPKGVELAIRTRALEFAMNRPPVVVCGDPSLGTTTCRNVEDLTDENHYGNERPAKAFWSGYRNLTNEGSSRNEEMKASFTLTELAPQPVSFPDNSLSTMLGGPKGKRPKQYVDLKLQLVNYATFFTALIARDDVLNAAGQVVKAEGACDVSKIAVPVPGFPMGFYKNPEVVTYYAVKGEANFQGLFNPFSTPSTKLTAYAAAKPMGGRIGPALFRAGSGSDETAMSTRTTANNRRSTPYLSGLDLSNVKRKGTNIVVPVGSFAPGMPIPINRGPTQEERFWIADPSDQVGGWVSGPGIVFGVPNLVYDFSPGITDPNSYISALPTNIIVPNPKGPSDDGYSSGLYKREQLTMFRANLEGVDNVEDITKSIYNVRAPTAYEAANYTIPFPYDLGLQPAGGSGNFLDTFGFVVGEKTSRGSGIPRYEAKIYAPIFSASNQDALFTTAAEVGAEIKNFMNVQTSAMEKYRNSMNLVAKTIFDDDPVKYREAAERISDFPFNLNPTDGGARPTCKSIAGTFLHFYFGDTNTLGNSTGTLCPQPLTESIDSYFNSGNLDFDAHTHTIEYSYRDTDHPRPDIIKWDKLLTGYAPGPMRGATEDGNFSTPYSGDQETMRRTGYSTKLVTLKSLTSSGHYNTSVNNSPVYVEGTSNGFAPLSEDVRQNGFRNALELSALGVPDTVNH